jgi:hypothetical protein
MNTCINMINTNNMMINFNNTMSTSNNTWALTTISISKLFVNEHDENQPHNGVNA